MASFPTSVKSFTTKNDGPGNNINAAHVNDLQDEVNAIEAGYLNGTARLNAAGSTVASLSVTGGSTVAALTAGASTLASLSLTGASTFAVRPVTVAPEMALVYLESTYAAGSSAISTIAWTAQSILTNSSIHSTGTNPTRLIPQSTGVFHFTAQIAIDQTIAANSPFQLELNDSTGTALGITRAPMYADAVAPTITVQVQGYKRFDVTGGYVTVRALSSVASSRSFSSGVGGGWASMVKL